jgi:S-DNA-T family DNA segregation ATPase FtsK/SpoIIIE
VSLLQRKLRIGYSRAARIIENLEEQGIVGPPDPKTGVREVLDYGEYGPLNED